MSNRRFAPFVVGVGLGFVTLGVGLWSIPAALITAGVIVAALGVLFLDLPE